MQIVFVSGHHPADTPFAQVTRRLFQAYTQRHGYGFFYDVSPSPPDKQQQHHLHYRRCASLCKAAQIFPTADWYVWVDSDVIVNKPDLRVESCIDLTDKMVRYHLFHEHPWDFAINSGVKFVNASAIPWELKMHQLQDTPPWNEFPFEQKALFEYVLPRLQERYRIHDPYVLNHILYQVRPTHNNPNDALFVHVCARTTEQRNNIMNIFETEKRIMESHEDPSIKLF
jgi:hypothetical protein